MKVWTTARLVKLTNQYATHPDREELAQELGVTMCAMQKKIVQLGLKRSPFARSQAAVKAGKARRDRNAERRRQAAEAKAREIEEWARKSIQRIVPAPAADQSVRAVVARQPEIARVWR